MRRRPDPVAPLPSKPVDLEADRREALRLVPVSRETEERFAIYAERLRRWQAIVNLVGPSTLQNIWTRHIADSAQLLAYAPAARHWVDLGSGAGFPGLVIAILLADEPGSRVDLVESNNRKCAFLREVARATDAPAVVHAGRIEAIIPHLGAPVEVVTSRALAPLDHLVDLGRPLLEQGALGLFLTGHEAEEGSASLSPEWMLDTAPSKTHPKGRVAMVRRSGSWDNAP